MYRGIILGAWEYFGSVGIFWKRGNILGVWEYFGSVGIFWERRNILELRNILEAREYEYPRSGIKWEYRESPPYKNINVNSCISPPKGPFYRV